MDAADIERLKGMPWRIYRSGRHAYARAVIRRQGGRGGWPYVMMHRYLLDLEFGDPQCVDHIDGNGLNNSRSNLRICSRGDNARNRGPTTGRVGYKGVHLQQGSYVSRLGNPRQMLGTFVSAVEGAVAYNTAAERLYGEFANLNRIVDEAGVIALVREREHLQGRIEQINKLLLEWPWA